MKVYIDCEFDSLRVKRAFQQCIVSIGAVVVDEEYQEVDRFYALVCPKRFRGLTRVVKKMTALQDEAIRDAESFAVVMDRFYDWMERYKDHHKRTLYSFGPDDKRTLLSHAKYEGYERVNWIQEIQDLQRKLSGAIQYQGRVISPTLSLDDVKLAFDVEGDVIHNALNDAIDLMKAQIHMEQQRMNEANVKAIWERKEEKRLAVAKRERERMIRILTEKYAHSHDRTYIIPMYHHIVEQLITLEERQHPFKMKYYEDEFLYENHRYAYVDTNIKISWHVLELNPYIELWFHNHDHVLAYHLSMNYANASILDGISRVSKEYVLPEDALEERKEKLS